MLLALDTSTRFAGIALYESHRGLIAEANWHAGAQHTVTLLPRVSQMMREHGAVASDLTAIAVARGPGSFTGLRVGLAAAKGLALATGAPLIGIPTLDATAYPHRLQPLPIVAVVQAGRGRICWAIYRLTDEASAKTEYTLSDAASLAETVKEPVLLVGELSPDDRSVLQQALDCASVVAPPSVAMRRAGSLAEMAWYRHSQKAYDDAAALNAIYLQELGAAALGRSTTR
jgi:tRNA threonylcarbamoyladenosine biosynthesis protein TsaB